MAKNDDIFEKAFNTLREDGIPTIKQKEMMLDNIAKECSLDEEPGRLENLKQLIVTYPWRFAFSVSAAQAVIMTAIFGTRYTNLFLRVIGG